MANTHDKRKRREALVKKQKGRCYFCGTVMTKKPNKPNSITLDHFPRNKREGGTYAWSNAVASCLKCNNLRDQSPQEFFQRLLKLVKRRVK